MNALRGRKGFQRKHQMTAAEDIGPTPETVAKLEGDALLELVQTGRISVDQERSGREINSVWETLYRLIGGGVKADYGRAGGGGGRDLPDAMSFGMARMLANRHQPWASREIEKTLAPGVTRYGIVWRLCNLNWPLRAIARNTGLHEAVVLRALRDSLDVYQQFAKRDQ